MIGHVLRGASLAALACAILGASACASTGGSSEAEPDKAREALAPGLDASANPDPYPSTYQPLPRENFAVVGATVLTGTDRKIENGVVVVIGARLPEGTAVRARARFIWPSELMLDDGRRVQARAVVIATGSQAQIPEPFRNLGPRILTNETIFELPDLPDSLAVIGGGPIGVLGRGDHAVSLPRPQLQR